MQKSKIKNQNLGMALPRSDKEELIAEIEENWDEKQDKQSTSMKISGKKVFDLKKIIDKKNEKNHRDSRSDR